MKPSSDDIEFVLKNGKCRQRLRQIQFELKRLKKLTPATARYVIHERKRLEKKLSARSLVRLMKSEVVVNNLEPTIFAEENKADRFDDEIERKLLRQINEQINDNNERSMKLGNPANTHFDNRLLLKELILGWDDVRELKNCLFFYRKNGFLKEREVKKSNFFVIEDCNNIEVLDRLNRSLNTNLSRARKKLRTEQHPGEVRILNDKIEKCQNDKRRIREQKKLIRSLGN